MTRMLRRCVVALYLLAPSAAIAVTADLVRVNKSEARLYLLKGGTEFASFHVAFGAHPQGPKTRQGDGRTPEGRYVLDARNAHSSFYKSLHVSYPNAEDRRRAERQRVSPGGDIMVHGQPNGWGAYAAITQQTNWTLGCIALSNEDMDIVWDSVPVGTPIQIEP
jgi:murein L,D-transpeptidase YafK